MSGKTDIKTDIKTDVVAYVPKDGVKEEELLLRIMDRGPGDGMQTRSWTHRILPQIYGLDELVLHEEWDRTDHRILLQPLKDGKDRIRAIQFDYVVGDSFSASPFTECVDAILNQYKNVKSITLFHTTTTPLEYQTLALENLAECLSRLSALAKLVWMFNDDFMGLFNFLELKSPEKILLSHRTLMENTFKQQAPNSTIVIDSRLLWVGALAAEPFLTPLQLHDQKSNKHIIYRFYWIGRPTPPTSPTSAESIKPRGVTSVMTGATGCAPSPTTDTSVQGPTGCTGWIPPPN